jgi:hypothetical protein
LAGVKPEAREKADACAASASEMLQVMHGLGGGAGPAAREEVRQMRRGVREENLAAR